MKVTKNEELIVHALAEFRTQSDRGVAVVGAALIDDVLKDHLKSLLKKPSQKKGLEYDEFNFLFFAEGPLGTSRAKAALAHFMGIIGPQTFKDLHYVRKIRNAFSHWPLGRSAKQEAEPLTFDTQQISAWAKHLKMADQVQWSEKIGPGPRYGAPPNTPRMRYIKTIWGIFVGLDVRTRKADSPLLEYLLP